MPIDATMKRRFVAYLRISIDKQGAKGLGMDAQRQAAEIFLKSASEGAGLVAEFVEVESGRENDEEGPMLANTLERCGLTAATPIIAKLDRLSCDVNYSVSTRP